MAPITPPVRFDEKLERLERELGAVARGFRGKGAHEERKTEEGVWDRATLDAVYRLMKRGLVETVDFPISTGKEADVYHATTPQGKSIALKVYRTSTADFKAIERYILGDPRFPARRTTTRDVIYTWARKEWLNLRMASEAGVPVPEPLDQQRNVLGMAYIGTEVAPAPEMRHVELEDPEAFMDEVLDGAARLYQVAGLVHGDLSEYNVLVHEGRPVIIDLGQAMLLRHPWAAELLDRDCANVARYFSRLGVDTDAAAVKARITTPKKGKGKGKGRGKGRGGGNAKPATSGKERWEARVAVVSARRAAATKERAARTRRRAAGETSRPKRRNTGSDIERAP